MASTGRSVSAPRIRLPPANPKHWVPTHKAAVVNAVNTGVLTLDEACQRYGLTVEEFRSWQHGLKRQGMAGLRVQGVEERRTETRSALREPAEVRRPQQTTTCYIIDLSAKGARLVFETGPTLPKIFELFCIRTGRGIRVCRVWQRDRQAGVSFELAAPWAIEAGVDKWLLGER